MEDHGEQARGSQHEPAGDRRIDEFLGEPTHDLEGWRWLWHGDQPFPLKSYRPGFRGRLTLAIKRFLQPLVRSPQATPISVRWWNAGRHQRRLPAED